MQKKPAHEGCKYSAICTFPKSPKVSDLKKEWCVYFHYLYDGEWQPIRRKNQINRIKTFNEKVKELKALKKALEVAMDRGWNPVTGKFPDEAETMAKVANERMTIIAALEFALKQADISDNTRRNYKNCLEKIKQAILLLHLEDIPMANAQRKHMKIIMETAAQKNKWSAKSFNKYLGYFQSLISGLFEWEIIEYNPAHRIKKKKVFENAPKFVPYTEEEKKAISDHFYLHHYGYFVFFMTCYHTGMRPMEVLATKIKDIDLNRCIISISPDRQRKNSKTRKHRVVQINPHLLPLLREWISDTTDRDKYIYGSPYESGKGNKGSSIGRTGDGVMHPDYFKPSFTRIKRDTVTRFWKKVVIDHLKINKYQYAAKHTSTDDKLRAGISLSAIQDLFGHTTEFMTTRYQTILKEMHRQEINEKSPAFVPK